jgi:hypothetical protein
MILQSCELYLNDYDIEFPLRKSACMEKSRLCEKSLTIMDS